MPDACSTLFPGLCSRHAVFAERSGSKRQSSYSGTYGLPQDAFFIPTKTPREPRTCRGNVPSHHLSPIHHLRLVHPSSLHILIYGTPDTALPWWGERSCQSDFTGPPKALKEVLGRAEARVACRFSVAVSTIATSEPIARESGLRESDPPPQLGKLMHYRCAKAAYG